MKIEHLAIWVKDLEKMKSFYEHFFNGKAGEKYHNPIKKFTSYFLSFENGCRLELMHQPEMVEIQEKLQQEFIGIAHFAVSVGSKEKVNSLTNELRMANYKVVGEARMTGDGYYESVVLDAEGNRIEITI